VEKIGFGLHSGIFVGKRHLGFAGSSWTPEKPIGAFPLHPKVLEKIFGAFVSAHIEFAEKPINVFSAY
jgi:hypothetical protein